LSRSIRTPAQLLASRLATARGAYERFFGHGPDAADTLRVVETQESLPAEFGASDDPGGASFPGGVLLDARAFAAGLSSEPVVELAEYELAPRGRLDRAPIPLRRF